MEKKEAETISVTGRPNKESSKLKAQKSKLRGFTLIEVLFVLFLFTILLGMVIPRAIGSLSNFQLREGGKRIKMLIEYSRNKSMAEGTYCQLNMKEGNNRYSLSFSRSPSFSGEETKEVYSLPAGIFFKEESQIIFYPNGKQTSAIITISDKRGKVYEIELSQN